MKSIIYLALISLLGLSSCITINRRYEFNLIDSTNWKYDDGRCFYEIIYNSFDKFDPKKYYSYKTDKFMININRVKKISNCYSIGLLLPIIPIFNNLEELGNYPNYYGYIGRIFCNFKSKGSLKLNNCYLDVDRKFKLRPVIGQDSVNWVNGNAYWYFDTNKVVSYRAHGYEYSEHTLWFELLELVKESAVLYFDSVYVDNKLVNIPPLPLKKVYVIYIDEEVHKLLR